MNGFGDAFPARDVRLLRAIDPERGKHLVVEAFRVIGQRHVIDRTNVPRLNDRRFAHVAEERELAPLLLRNRPVRAAEQNVRLDAD